MCTQTVPTRRVKTFPQMYHLPFVSLNDQPHQGGLFLILRRSPLGVTSTRAGGRTLSVYSCTREHSLAYVSAGARVSAVSPLVRSPGSTTRNSGGQGVLLVEDGFGSGPPLTAGACWTTGKPIRTRRAHVSVPRTGDIPSTVCRQQRQQASSSDRSSLQCLSVRPSLHKTRREARKAQGTPTPPAFKMCGTERACRQMCDGRVHAWKGESRTVPAACRQVLVCSLSREGEILASIPQNVSPKIVFVRH